MGNGAEGKMLKIWLYDVCSCLVVVVGLDWVGLIIEVGATRFCCCCCCFWYAFYPSSLLVI